MPAAIPMPPHFAEVADLSKRELMRRFHVSAMTIQRWRLRVGKANPPSAPRPMPDGFAAVAPGLTFKALGQRYGAPWRVIRRWCREAGVEPGKTRSDATPVPDDFEARAAEMTKSELARHYAVGHYVVARWLRETDTSAKAYSGPAPRPRAAPLRGRFVLPGPVAPLIPPPPAGREEEAAHYLRRFYTGIFHCGPNGGADPRGRFWRCGNAVLTGDELVERAERKGFDPDEWKRLPVPIRRDAGAGFSHHQEGGRHG